MIKRLFVIQSLILFGLFSLLVASCEIEQVIVNDSQKQFITEISLRAQKINQDIVLERQQMLGLEKKHNAHQKIKSGSIRWLTKLAHQYNIKAPNFKYAGIWHLLELRVDAVPTSLVTAQAINESAWGHSRFAAQANNYFGQHCKQKGCGVVPKHLAADSTFEISRFINMTESVKSYMNNLNTNPYYKQFRQARLSMRRNQKPLDAVLLSTYVEIYAEHPDYVKILQGLMKKYNLLQLD